MRNMDMYGIPLQDLDNILEMLEPRKCLRCGHIHDAGKVKVVARHSDHSVWKCPNCKAKIDDRLGGWTSERVRFS